MKRISTTRATVVLFLIGVVGTSTKTFAAGFQLFEQDGASVGNYHAGYAAIADDASTSFYNPAGMVRIKNQELVFGGNAITPSFKYVGTVTVNTINGGNDLLPVTAQGGIFAFVPFGHYVAPISDAVYFGFSVDAPFGLKTNYGRTTDLRYIATLSSVMVVDYSPSLAVLFNDNKTSFGVGLDIQHMYGEFDSMGTLAGGLNTNSTNSADDTAYGFHAGVLYQFTDYARVGLSYHSQVTHHLSGTSKFVGPLATLFNGGPIIARRTTTDVPLPSYTALSGYYRFAPCVAVMGSVIYTHWSVFDNLVLNNVAGLNESFEPSNQIQVTVPAHYKNSWNFALGGDWNITPFAMLRGGLGYDQSPVTNKYRNVQLPDGNRYIIALGGHYQFTEHVGADLSWLHVFMRQTSLNPPPQVTGAQISTTQGHVSGGADVLGGQIVWDMV